LLSSVRRRTVRTYHDDAYTTRGTGGTRSLRPSTSPAETRAPAGSLGPLTPATLLHLQRSAGNQAVARLLAPVVVQRRFRVPEGGSSHFNAGGRDGTKQQLIFDSTRVETVSVPWYDVMERHISVFPDEDGTAEEFHVTFELLPNETAGSAHRARADYEKAKAAHDPKASWRGGPRAPSAAGGISVHFFCNENGVLRNDAESKFPRRMSKRDYDKAVQVLTEGANKFGKAFATRLVKVEAAGGAKVQVPVASGEKVA